MTDAAPITSAPDQLKSGGGFAVVLSIANRILIVILQIATGIMTARMLQPHGRGELQAMNIWPLFLAQLATLGVPTSLIYYIRKRGHGRTSLVMHSFAVSILGGLVAAFVGAALMPLWMHQYSPSVIHCAQVLLILTLPLCSVMLTGQSALEAMGMFSASNAVQLMVPGATLAFLLYFYWSHRFNAYTAAIAYTFAWLPVALLIIYYLWRRWDPKAVWHWSLSELRLLLDYGLRSYGVDLLNAIAERVDTVLVIGMLAPAAMGVYAVMVSLSRTLNVFQTAVTMVLFPKAAGRSPQEILELTETSMRITVIVTAVSAAFVCLVGPFIVGRIYGHAYLTALTALRILLVELTISSAINVLIQAFKAAGRPGVVTILQSFGLALCVPMMFALIPRYGVSGAAASLLFSTCCRFLFILFAFRFILKTRLPRLMPTLDDLRLMHSVVYSRLRREPELVEGL